MSGSVDMHNKLVALREKETAEKMIMSKDYVNAREKLIRAHHLFPLDHIDSMLTVCEILSASTNKFPGYGMDFYWILSLPATATISDIRQQFQNLVMMLKIIMNQFPGTQLALKLVEDAFSTLSDNNRRSAFDLKRKTTWINYELPTPEVSSCSSEINQDYCNFDKDRKVNNLETDQIWAVQCQTNGLQNRRYAKIVTNSMFEVRVIWLKPVPVGDGERRWCEAGLPVACGSFCLDTECSELVSSSMLFFYKCSCIPGLTVDQFDIYPKKGEVWAMYEDWNLDEWSYNPNAISTCRFKLVEILSDFCKYSGVSCASLLKVSSFTSTYERQLEAGLLTTFHISPAMLYIFSHRVPAYRFEGGEVDGVVSGMLELDQLSLPDNMMKKVESSDGSSLSNHHLLNTMNTGQIWAVYSGKEFLPRAYVLIDNVISRTQVNVKILDPELMADEMDWKQNSLPISCGLFKAGGSMLKMEVSQLSHPVKFEKTISSYMIYPLKGQIWAMYQEWHQSDRENCQYCIVEILSDFTQGEKIVVNRLVEVKGYATFFHGLQLNGFEQSRKISRTEILSFSHEIPSYKVPDIGYYGIPDSSWHLEPNALPSKFLRT
ncbi:hypothetical protein M9H77_29110 [Catharanthus roseus]|uniref:Uncharacterized protein n=1 Tax=Catharanthus roseus TaxID=4058 RepID=A0ACC0AJX7_CATRO|nr:hypothetical protein M9H77_29110 [Catharanthus roseus]